MIERFCDSNRDNARTVKCEIGGERLGERVRVKKNKFTKAKKISAPWNNRGELHRGSDCAFHPTALGSNLLSPPNFSCNLMSVSLLGVAWTVKKALETKKPHLGARSFNPTLSFLSKWIRTWIAQLWAFCQRLWAPSLHRPLMVIKMLCWLLRWIKLRFLLQQNVDHSWDNCEKTMIDSESEVERFLCRIVKLKKIK